MINEQALTHALRMISQDLLESDKKTLKLIEVVIAHMEKLEHRITNLELDVHRLKTQMIIETNGKSEQWK